MRYSVFDKYGTWQASYSHNIPNVALKTIREWAILTGKLCAGKVYETIVPKDKKYENREHLLYDFTHLHSKLQEPSKYKRKKQSIKE
jgi:hypothetical protein